MPANRPMKRVTLIQRRLTHYRLPFFETLRSELAGLGIELTLGCGQGTRLEQSKNDAGTLAWARHLPTTYLAGDRICVQPFGHLAEQADMLVVTAENKLVNNLPYQFGHPNLRVALWGHGANLQGNPNSWRERFKARVARRADWWFGYTEMSRPLIARNGFPDDRITILNNSVDTSAMAQQHESLPAGDRAAWRRANGVGSGPVGIFLGSLYAGKRIDFLFQAAQAMRQELPSFELVLVGAGPLQPMVEAFCRANPWAHCLGVRNGLEKVRALAACDVMLNPGLVGLGVLDSFVCRVPMLTIHSDFHGPEIAYLNHGQNGLMTANDLAAYVQAALGLLRSAEELKRLSLACKESGQRYSVANMVRHFADGVQGCLAAPIWRGKH
ncbi:MAG: glycosyl transferase group 1 [Comamonadaceae bacterium]|nr:glycosyl transferase group 1 [Comamonadaceae bacterium]